MLYDVSINDKNYRLELDRADGRWTCRLDGRDFEIDAVLVRAHVLSLRIENTAYEIQLERLANDLRLWVGSKAFAVDIRDPRSLRGRAHAGEDHGPKKITAAMPGKVVRLLVREGEEVETGRGVAVIEAMKMQNELKSPKKGIVRKLLVEEGDRVNAGEVLAIVD
jgi:biotin carboxyl carrier protein